LKDYKYRLPEQRAFPEVKAMKGFSLDFLLQSGRARRKEFLGKYYS
jgi:hypothetical protein